MRQGAECRGMGGHDQPTVLAQLRNLVVRCPYANIGQCPKMKFDPSWFAIATAAVLSAGACA